MRHRVKSGKIGSFTPENQGYNTSEDVQEVSEYTEEVEEIFEEDSDFSSKRIRTLAMMTKPLQQWSFTTIRTSRNEYETQDIRS